jgi:5-methylphenazine-1-carboxylate 1-monooxygenase
MSCEEILVIGAGIGGLATALSLHDAGYSVSIFESVTEVRPVGAGINLLPHAVRELFELGLQPRLEHASMRPRELAW